MSATHTVITLGAAVFAGVASHSALSAFAASETATPEGYWRTIDDETDEAKGIVHITNQGGELTGKVVKLMNLETDDPHPTCDDCPGERKGQPVKGMTILWGVEREGNEWSGGTILDPESGDTYDASLELREGGQKLDVRGFIGFSMLGRTQTWERVDKPKLKKDSG